MFSTALWPAPPKCVPWLRPPRVAHSGQLARIQGTVVRETHRLKQPSAVVPCFDYTPDFIENRDPGPQEGLEIRQRPVPTTTHTNQGPYAGQGLSVPWVKFLPKISTLFMDSALALARLEHILSGPQANYGGRSVI